MGAGNPLVRSYDNELYDPTTFFIDFTPTKKDIEEHCKANEREVPEEDSEEWYRISGDLAEWDWENFESNCFEEDVLGLYEPTDSRAEELSASFRGSATIIGESFYLLLVTCGEDYHHMSIGCVPNFKMEDIEEDIDSNLNHEWYEQRDIDTYKVAAKKSEVEYNKKLKKFRKEAIEVMEKIHSMYGAEMSMRSGPWTSMSIKTIGKTFFKDNL